MYQTILYPGPDVVRQAGQNWKMAPSCQPHLDQENRERKPAWILRNSGILSALRAFHETIITDSKS